jgi:type IV pilus assembly protein PilQ
MLSAMPLNAATPQLTQVMAAVQGDATVVTIRANGAFTHTEYRPAENLLLVDLNGVSAGTDDKTHSLQVPGATSYRVLGYKSASGSDVARVEIALAPNVGVSVNEGENELQVRLTGAGSPAPETAETMAAPAAPAPVRESSAVNLRDVQVSRAAEGIEVSILANGPLTPKAMTLTSPHRLVIDLQNTTSSRKSREIAVNSEDVKAVRVARFQMNPPVTRVVVDLVGARDYQLLPEGNKLTLRFRPSESAAPAKDASPMKEDQQVESAQAAPANAQEFVMVQPAFENKGAAQEPKARASAAASKFGSPQPEIAFSAPVTPPTSAALDPQATSTALMQAQSAPSAPATTAGARTTSCREATRFTGEPISLNLKDADVKDFFRLVHEISGLNVVLDPQVRGNVTIVLDDVPWDQALAIVLKNNNMECELDGNVLRIATLDTLKKEADSRRAQLDAQLLAVPKVTVTRFLSYARAQEVTPTLKKFLTARGEVIADNRTNALIIEDVPSVIPNVDRLLKDLDRKTQEVEIEARVVAATRNFARDIGTQVGFGWGNNPTAVGGVGAVGSSPINVGVNNPLYFTIGSSIPLFSNLPALGPTSGLAFTNASSNYRVDVLLTMAESRGLLKILSRPRIVTQNNIQALVKQGVRVPVVTQAQLGGPPTVQYVDAFLRLTVTPQITAERTIFLNVDVENTVPDFSRQVQNNPTLLTQQATTQVLVTDGGTVVIGGVIQTQNSVNIQQVPLLGNIPIFGELFKRRSVSTSTQELIFFLTPRIIQT